jgi:crotonobetainyl-CoA:carnitine CoA-transferase CaiB-like acyl-CoA transferase
MPQRGALSGIRVLDFSEYIAGPYAGQMLADMGAAVTKIEPLQGDFWRLTGPVAPNESRGFMGVNKGKRSASIDLKRPESREIVLRAVRSADVLLQNYRPGVAERLGLDYETLAATNPRLICCENTAFGSSGPYRDRAGFDLASQAMTGIMSFEGAGGLPHPIITTSPTDLSAGMFMAFAVASALYQREQTGRGQRIETSLFGAGLAIQYRPMFSIESIDRPRRDALLQAVAEARARGERIDDVVAAHRAREGATRILNPYYKVYETQDSYIALACLNNRLRRLAAEAVGIDDPRVLGSEFDMNALGGDESLVLSELIAAIFTTRTTMEWAELFDARGVPAAPVRLTAELFDDPQVVSQDLLVDLEHPIVGKVRMANSPLRMSEAETGSREPSPALGQHTRDFLEELGFSPEEAATFERSDVVRTWNR